MVTTAPNRERKTAIIIGASRGLGLGLAREFARRGWQVTATARTMLGAAPRPWPVWAWDLGACPLASQLLQK